MKGGEIGVSTTADTGRVGFTKRAQEAADMPGNPFYKEHWVNIEPERLDRYQRMFQWNPASSALYEPADIRPGHIVAELGCGPGYTSIQPPPPAP
jgi:hypothetical protein